MCSPKAIGFTLCVVCLQKCTTAEGHPDLKKATLLLEVYAIEIQMYSAQKNFKKLKELYDKSLSIKSAIPHPRIMGIVRECGGKMHMREKAWEAAHTDFFEAFKSYDDAGSGRRCSALRPWNALLHVVSSVYQYELPVSLIHPRLFVQYRECRG